MSRVIFVYVAELYPEFDKTMVFYSRTTEPSQNLLSAHFRSDGCAAIMAMTFILN